MALPKEGTKAPEFEQLKALKGKHVVLYFYPKDDTPGCTVEACSFRDNVKKIENLNAVVLGVSPDDEKSHDKFIQKFKLPFKLVPDTDKKISQAYGVWGEKSFMGKKYMGVNRSTFLIAPDGKIEKVYEKVKPEAHAAEVLEFLNSVN